MVKKIPVVVIKEMSEVDKILPALKNDGIEYAEITFRTACAEEAIKYAVKNYPDMIIGAGTVINAEQCLKAILLKLQRFVKKKLCHIIQVALHQPKLCKR